MKAVRKQKYVEEHTYHNLTVIENIPIIDSIPSSNVIDLIETNSSELKEESDSINLVQIDPDIANIETETPELLEDLQRSLFESKR